MWRGIEDNFEIQNHFILFYCFNVLNLTILDIYTVVKWDRCQKVNDLYQLASRFT